MLWILEAVMIMSAAALVLFIVVYFVDHFKD